MTVKNFFRLNNFFDQIFFLTKNQITFIIFWQKIQKFLLNVLPYFFLNGLHWTSVLTCFNWSLVDKTFWSVSLLRSPTIFIHVLYHDHKLERIICLILHFLLCKDNYAEKFDKILSVLYWPGSDSRIGKHTLQYNIYSAYKVFCIRIFSVKVT